MDKCTAWGGRINPLGYGTIGIELAHRRAWAKVNGPIPDGMTIDHLCHSPSDCWAGIRCPHRSCINVEHMELVTAEENRVRSGAGGFQSRKTHCPRGHGYSGDNLMVSKGRRFCRRCRSESEQSRRLEKKLKRCLSLGHVRTEMVATNGAKYCSHCRQSQSEHASRVRWGHR